MEHQTIAVNVEVGYIIGKLQQAKLPAYCPEKSWRRNDLVGAHVQKTTTDMSWYIIPLCSEHNKSKVELEVSDYISFVSANVA